MAAPVFSPGILPIHATAPAARRGRRPFRATARIDCAPSPRPAAPVSTLWRSWFRRRRSMIDLHYWPTPNGHKITLMLGELAEAGARLDDRLHPVDIGSGAQFEPDFLAISPNNKMPAIVDHAPADGGAPLSVFESGAILLYLAEKTGRFLATDLRARTTTLEWLFWQMAGLGPMTGQYGHFHVYAPEPIEYAKKRYA